MWELNTLNLKICRLITFLRPVLHALSGADLPVANAAGAGCVTRRERNGCSKSGPSDSTSIISQSCETITGKIHIRMSSGFLPEIVLYINFVV